MGRGPGWAKGSGQLPTPWTAHDSVIPTHSVACGLIGTLSHCAQ